MVGTIHTMPERDMILSNIPAQIRKTTHKYGMEIPTRIENALEIDRSNNNTLFWKNTLAKEMMEVGVACEVLEEGTNAPIGSRKKGTGHLVWDVEMDFTHKAR